MPSKGFAVELFLRRGLRVELTEAGRGLFEITRRMFSQEAEALDFLNECRDLRTGHLRVGSVGPASPTCWWPSTRAFLASMSR